MQPTAKEKPSTSFSKEKPTGPSPPTPWTRTHRVRTASSQFISRYGQPWKRCAGVGDSCIESWKRAWIERLFTFKPLLKMPRITCSKYSADKKLLGMIWCLDHSAEVVIFKRWRNSSYSCIKTICFVGKFLEKLSSNKKIVFSLKVFFTNVAVR